MVRKIETQAKKKKKIGVKIFLLLILVLLVLAGFGYFGKGPFKGMKKWFAGKQNTPVEIKVLDELKDFGYKISDRDTKYYKEEFAKMKKIINADPIDTKQYAEYVARMFVNDLYTMSTKVNKYDVGGIEYYHKNDLDDYTKSVMDTLYKTMLDDTYGTREQKLPEVASVETISVEETTYDVGGTVLNGYKVKLKWTYVNDMGYDNQGTVIVVPEGDSGRWSVVDYQNKI